MEESASTAPTAAKAASAAAQRAPADAPAPRYGALLRGFRARRGLSLRAVAAAAGLHPQELSRSEAGRRRPADEGELLGLWDLRLPEGEGEVQVSSTVTRHYSSKGGTREYVHWDVRYAGPTLVHDLARFDDAVEALSSLMEPMIMVVLGTLIGGMVIAMYLPIFKMGQAI